MELYENDGRTGLERLTDDSDIRYATCVEAQEIWGAVGADLDTLRKWAVRALDNCTIRKAGADGLSRWERFLDIRYWEPAAIEFRRSTVAAAFTPTHHIGRPEIIGIMGLYTERGGTVEFDAGTVRITVDGYLSDEMAFLEQVRRRLPAHLGLGLTIVIRRECRAEWPFATGTARGSLITSSIGRRKRAPTLELGAVHASRLTGRVEARDANTHRRDGIELPSAMGGAAAVCRADDIAGMDREARAEMVPHARLESRTIQRAEYADAPPRESRLERKAATGGASFANDGPTGIAPPRPRGVDAHAPSAGGAFVRTHRTARTIGTED